MIYSDDELLLYAHHHALAAQAIDGEPQTWRQMLKRPDASFYIAAGGVEIAHHRANDTWEVVHRSSVPAGCKVLDCKWVLNRKYDGDGNLDKYKARVVAKGFSQRPGFDYSETFAPTFRQASMRLICALAAEEDLHMRSIDITAAFTNGDLDEEIYMKQPDGFVEGGPDYVLRLRKSLYGLKQAARQWNTKLHSVLDSLGYKRLDSDRSLYVFVKDDVRIIVPIWVDDITLASRDSGALDEAVIELAKHFKLKDLGPTSWLLKMRVERDWENHTVSLSQRQYILDTLARFGMSDCKPVLTPLNPNVRLSKDQAPQTHSERAEMAEVPYMNAVGAILYLAMCTRPDISYTAGVLARFSSNPGPDHWLAVKHLLRYLKGTADLKLVFGRSQESERFSSFTDADHAGNPDNGKSTGGYMTRMAGGAVGWQSKLQPIVTLSTTEAEYVAAVEAGKEMLWTRNILAEIGEPVQGASTLQIDNQSSVQVAQNPEHHGRMKHLDLRFFWLRDEVERGQIGVKYVPTDENPADLLTKALTPAKVVKFRQMFGLF